MAEEALLKTRAGMDTKDFNKGVQEMKKQMKDLDKVSSSAFSDIGKALGIDTGKIQQFASAIGGVGVQFKKMGAEGTQSFGSILKAIGPVAAGIAGLGLAAAIAAFKALNAEADAFEATIQGGAIAKQTEAYTSTVRQYIRDQQNIGQQAANFREEFKEAWANLGAFVRSGFNSDMTIRAIETGGRAKQIAKELYDLDIKRKEVAVKVSEIDAQIAQKREIISDTTRSTAERQQALAEAQDLIKQKLDLQLPIERRQRDLLVEYNKLASTTVKEYEAECAAKITVNNLVQQEAAEQRSLLRQQKSLNTEVTKEATERQKAVDALAQEAEQMMRVMADRNILTITMPRVEGSPLNNQVVADVKLNVPQVEVLNFKSMLQTEFAGMTVEVGLELDSEKLNAIAQQAAEGIKSALTNVIVSLSESIGQLIGDLATGKDGWGDFTNSAISAFGDMAIAIGKIAIEAGTSCLAIKAALDSLSPAGAYLAIAAGAALVALGSAVKAGMANVANGNYSSSMGSYSSTSSSMVSDYEGREVTVNVTGTLQADGDQLVAVINNSNKKSYYTT